MKHYYFKSSLIPIVYFVFFLIHKQSYGQTPTTMEFGTSTIVIANGLNPSADQSFSTLLNGFDVSMTSSNSRIIAFALSGNGAGTNATAGGSDAALFFGGGSLGTTNSSTLSTDSGGEIGITSFDFAYEYNSAPTTLSFTASGKKDGIEVGTKIINALHNTLVNVDLTNPTTGSFSDIDELVLTPSSPIIGGWSIDSMIIIAAVSTNSAPTASSFTASSGPFEDQTYTFATADFSYNDTDSDPLDNLLIEILPAIGTLYVDANSSDTFDTGEQLSMGSTVSKADLDAGNLQYIQTGSVNTSFQFEVNDGIENSTGNYVATLNVTAVNDEPSFTAGANEVVNEDAGAQTVNNWATSIDDGDSDATQTLTFTVTNDNNLLFSAQPAISASGNLTYTPAANANGSATVDVVLSDDGGTANGGDDTFTTQQFTITVNAVNDEPSFTAGANEAVNEDAGAQIVNGWATAIDDGDSDATQTLTFTVTNNNNGLFSAQPAIDATGNLTYTPAADANGSATVSVVLTDDGGTANGGDDTFATQQFTITVNAVNDEPSFTAGANEAVNEDAGAQTVNGWATAIDDGDSDATQTLTFTVTNDNNSLFSVQPAISASGNLTYTPAADANGSATVSVILSDDGGTANGGDDTFATQQFTITVNAVNDEPSFTAGANEAVNEDAGAQTVNGWATAIDDGDSDATQTLTFTVTNDNNSLFSVQPAISASGNLTYTPAADANGSATVSVVLSDDGGTANGGDDTFATQQFTITVNAVNDEPSFTAGANEAINEDAGAQTVNGWATAIDDGDADAMQTLSFNVSNDNNVLFSAQPAIDATGNLTYTPTANASGSATVTVSISDNGGTANGGDDTSDDQTFTITVNSVNDEPSFTAGANEAVNEDAGAQTVNGWATAIDDGDADAMQTLNFNVSNNNNALFSTQPAIDATGNLTYTPAADASGSATVTVSISDDGGTANGGDDTSDDQTFTITVNSVNDEPSFTAGANEAVNEDAGAQTVNGWATAIDDGDANAMQTLNFNVSNNNNALFSAQPAIDATGNLTYTPAADASGSATVTVSISDDGGTANGGDDTSDDQTFTITVNSVNDEPSFTAGANEAVNEDAGAQTVNGWATAIDDGDANAMQTLNFNVSNDNNALFSAQPAIDATGNLTYTPAADASGSATVTVSISDDGGTANGGDDTSDDQTFTITV
ncbi:Ig-like domain-containing protein, partial [uncultured Aquimarina sp.]|uniref:beta strand repeat-containing protein n=1 Tax=uncultured Aquimarina sp. TaxID=575652 RepID=UPI002627957F